MIYNIYAFSPSQINSNSKPIETLKQLFLEFFIGDVGKCTLIGKKQKLKTGLINCNCSGPDSSQAISPIQGEGI